MKMTRAFGYSLTGHTVILCLLLGTGLWRGCIRPPHPPKDQMMFVEMASPSPPAETPDRVEPDLPPIVPPVLKDIPIPKQKPEPKPEPKPKPKPAVERSEKKIPRPPVVKQPPMTAQQIRNMLEKGMPTSSAVNTADLPAWYFQGVKQQLYDAWTQPRELTAASRLSVEVRLRVRRNGTLESRTITRRSGHAGLDASVQAVLDSLTRITPLPDTYRGAYRDISVVFEIEDR